MRPSFVRRSRYSTNRIRSNRSRDLAFALVAFYSIYAIVLPSFSSNTQIILAFSNALVWRCFHSFGLGLALKKQSEKKWITRHFFKHYHFEKEGGAVESAFTNWKATYNLSLCLSYGESSLLSLSQFVWLIVFGITNSFVLRVGLEMLYHSSRLDCWYNISSPHFGNGTFVPFSFSLRSLTSFHSIVIDRFTCLDRSIYL